MQTSHSERDHSKHSPSSLKFKELCPGWVNDDDDDRFTSQADEGTLMHEAAESRCLDKLDVNQKHFVTNVIEYVERLEDGAEEIIREKRIFHADPVLKQFCHGTPDELILTGDHCHLIDYKFGRRPVDHAWNNVQGFAYALAVWDTYPQINLITVHFLVPRVAEGFSNYRFERGLDYSRLKLRVKRIVERAENLSTNTDEYRPDFEACLYCGRKATCKPLGNLNKLLYSPETNTISKAALERAVKSGEDQDEKDVSTLFAFAKVVKSWAKQYEKHALNRHLNEGINIDGYELRFRKGQTTVDDTTKAIDALQTGEGVDLETLIKACDLNQKKLEVLLTEGLSEEEASKVKLKIHATLSKSGTLKTSEDSKYLFKLNKTKKKVE